MIPFTPGHINVFLQNRYKSNLQFPYYADLMECTSPKATDMRCILLIISSFQNQRELSA